MSALTVSNGESMIIFRSRKGCDAYCIVDANANVLIPISADATSAA